MSKVTFIEVVGIDGVEVEHAIIDRGNDEFTSMPKSVWDEQQATKEARGTLSQKYGETLSSWNSITRADR